MILNPENLIWIDLEMTGLNPDTDFIIEIATVVTDAKLNILAEGPVFAIHQSDHILNVMDNWNQKQHTKSGLVERVKNSHITEAQAETETIEFLKQYVLPGKSPMCGNSICQDRRFLSRFMPQLEQYFHYRHVDVSTVKELAMRWKPSIMPAAKKLKGKIQHLALQDIYDSIKELEYYKQHFFNGEETHVFL